MKSYTLILTQAQLDILSAAIGEIPTKHGVPLLNSINAQIAEQVRAEQAAAAKAAEPAPAAVPDLQRAQVTPTPPVLLNGAAA